MNVQNLIRNIACLLLCISTNINAMDINHTLTSENSQNSKTTTNVTSELCINICQLKNTVNSNMFLFHRNLLNLESDIYEKITEIRHHICQLEMSIEKQISAKIYNSAATPFSVLTWPQWVIATEKDEPLFLPRQNINLIKTSFHSQTLQILQQLQQLSTKKPLVKTENRHILLSEFSKFDLVLEEHLFGLHNDMKRLESISDKQLFVPLYDFLSLKSKMDLSQSELQNFVSSESYIAHPELQQTILIDLNSAFPMVHNYIQLLEMAFSKNVFGLCEDIHALRALIHEDMFLLQQQAKAFQLDVFGELLDSNSVL